MLTQNKPVSAWRYFAILPLCLALALISMNPAKVIAQSSTNEEVSTKAEKMPDFNGGSDAMFEFIAKNTKYPKEARENKVEGRVVLQFTVNTNGKISDIEVLKSPDQQLEKEAIRVVKLMPKWKPAMQDGKPVALRMVLPFSFKLK